MKKILLLLFIVFSTSYYSYSQTWEESYEIFAKDYQAQNFEKAIESGNKTLALIGQKDTNYFHVMGYVAFAYYGNKNYEMAVATYKDAMDLCSKLYGENNYTYVLTKYNLAINYTYTGKYSKAYPLMEEVIDYIVKDQGKNSMDFINTANQQANIYNIAGSYSKAEEIYTDVYNVVKENYKETDSMYMATVNVVAPFYFAHGMFEKAEPFYTHAIEIMEKMYTKLSANYLASLNSLGEFYLKAGMYAKSEKVYTQMVDLCKQFYGENSADYATPLNNLAVTFEKQGKNKEAEEAYKRCLKVKEKVYKKESGFYALTLSNLGVLYDNMGLYIEAEDVLSEAVAIYKKVYGESDPNYASSISNLASIYSSNGKYKEAIDLTQQAMEIQKKLYGEKYDGYLTSLNNLALMYEQMGDYNSAEKESEKNVQLRKETQGENHPDYAVSLYNLANIKIIRREYKTAEALLKQALDIQRATVGSNSAAYATTLNSLAALYSVMGNYELAGETYESCRIIFEKVYGDMHPEYATFLNNYGMFFYETGNYDKSEEILRKSLAIQYKAFGKEHPNNVNMLCNLANTMMSKGNNKLAEEYLLESVKITKEKMGVDHPNYVGAVLGLGVYYYNTGNYEKGEKCYLEALDKKGKIYGKKSPEYSNVLNNLGTLYLYKAIGTVNKTECAKLVDKAADCLMQVLKIDSITVGVNHPDYATHLNNLAELYRNTDQYEKAEPLYLQSIDLEHEIFGENYPNLAMTYNNLSLMYSGEMKYDLAEEYCLKSLKLKQATFGENNPIIAETVSSLAYIYECKKNIPEATKYYTKAASLNTELIKNNFSFLSENEKSNFLKANSVLGNMLASFAMKNQNSNSTIAGLVYNNELFYKGILLRSTDKMKNIILNGKDEDLKTKYSQWIGIKQQLSNLYAMPVANRYDSIGQLEESANKLEKELVLKSNDFANNSKNLDVDWKKIKEKLSPTEIAIEFISYHADLNKNSNETFNFDTTYYFALVLAKDYPNPKMIKLCSETALEKVMHKTEIYKTTSQIKGITPIVNSYIVVDGDNNTLYDLIWAQLDTLVKGKTAVYISLSGLLNKVSLNSLEDKNKQLLLNKNDIHFVNSTRQIALKQVEKENAIKTIALFGGINYELDSNKTLISQKILRPENNDISMRSFASDTSRSNAWIYLGGTLTEINNINKLFKEKKWITTEFIGKNGNEESFKSLNGKNSPAILHISTHGFFFPEADSTTRNKTRNPFKINANPLYRSGLILAGANYAWQCRPPIENTDDGVLTSYEVANSNLSNTELVVLSACETGLGDIKTGEGVYGLQRAFQVAGAKSVIMSLWSVPDRETTELMSLFYNNWLKGIDKHTAFRQAQIELAKKYPSYYWAAFILVE